MVMGCSCDNPLVGSLNKCNKRIKKLLLLFKSLDNSKVKAYMDHTKVSVKRNVLQQIWQDLVSNRGPQANKPQFPQFFQANTRLLYQTGPWWFPYTSF